MAEHNRISLVRTRIECVELTISSLLADMKLDARKSEVLLIEVYNFLQGVTDNGFYDEDLNSIMNKVSARLEETG